MSQSLWSKLRSSSKLTASSKLPSRQPSPMLESGNRVGECGNALVELAVVLSILGIPLLLGSVYTSYLVLQDIEIANAAHSGALYGMTSSTFAADTSGIVAAARADAPSFGANLTVTPVTFYACSGALSGTLYSTQAAANSACTGGANHSLQLVQVTATGSVTPPVRVPGLAKTVSMSSISIMEVEE